MGNTDPILSGQNMAPRFLMCSMLLNILTVLANFPGLIIQFSQKTLVTTVATLYVTGSSAVVDPLTSATSCQLVVRAVVPTAGIM